MTNLTGNGYFTPATAAASGRKGGLAGGERKARTREQAAAAGRASGAARRAKRAQQPVEAAKEAT